MREEKRFILRQKRRVEEWVTREGKRRVTIEKARYIDNYIDNIDISFTFGTTDINEAMVLCDDDVKRIMKRLLEFGDHEADEYEALEVEYI